MSKKSTASQQEAYFALKQANADQITAHIAEDPIKNATIYFHRVLFDDLQMKAGELRQMYNELAVFTANLTIKPTDQQIANYHLRMLAKLDETDTILATMGKVGIDIFRHLKEGHINLDGTSALKFTNIIHGATRNAASVKENVALRRAEILAQGKVKVTYSAIKPKAQSAKPRP